MFQRKDNDNVPLIKNYLVAIQHVSRPRVPHPAKAAMLNTFLYLLTFQLDIAEVNDAYNELLIEEEQVPTLRDSILNVRARVLSASSTFLQTNPDSPSLCLRSSPTLTPSPSPRVSPNTSSSSSAVSPSSSTTRTASGRSRSRSPSGTSSSRTPSSRRPRVERRRLRRRF
jgi:hypothetical protein